MNIHSPPNDLDRLSRLTEGGDITAAAALLRAYTRRGRRGDEAWFAWSVVDAPSASLWAAVRDLLWHATDNGSLSLWDKARDIDIYAALQDRMATLLERLHGTAQHPRNRCHCDAIRAALRALHLRWWRCFGQSDSEVYNAALDLLVEIGAISSLQIWAPLVSPA